MSEPCHRGKDGLDVSRLDHLMGFKTSLADARLRRAFHQRMKPLKLRPVDFTILLLLAANEGVSQKSLCGALDISAPGLAVILDRLQARDLLVRERNENDKREHRLALTETGKCLALEAESISHGLEAEALSSLTHTEQEMLAYLLNKMLGVESQGFARNGKATLTAYAIETNTG